MTTDELRNKNDLILDVVEASELSTFFNFSHSHLESEQERSSWLNYQNFIHIAQHLSSMGWQFGSIKLHVTHNSYKDSIDDHIIFFNVEDFHELLHLGNMMFAKMAKRYESQNNFEKQEWCKNKILSNYKLYKFLTELKEKNHAGDYSVGIDFEDVQ